MLNLPQIGFHGIKPLDLSSLQVSEDTDDALGIMAYEHTFKVPDWFSPPCRSLESFPALTFDITTSRLQTLCR